METTQIKNYLLGSIPADVSATLEEQLLTDDDFFELLQAEEDELIDQYLTGELSPAERQQFEQIFLAAPERRERLSWAQTLHQELSLATMVNETSSVAPQTAFIPQPSPWWRVWLGSPAAYVAAAVLVAMLAFGLWRTNMSPPTLGTFILTPNASRDGSQTKVIAVPPGASQINLQLELIVVESGPYQAILRDGAGNTKQRWEGLQPQTKQPFVLEVSTAHLDEGTYRINLMTATNASPTDEFVFQVTR